MAEVRRTPQARREKETPLISTAEGKRDVTDIDRLSGQRASGTRT